MQKMTRYTTTTLMTLAIMATACVEMEDDFEDVQPRLTQTEQIIQNLEAAGFPTSDIGVTTDGTVFVGGDAVVSLQASRELAGIIDDSEASEGFRQYRTTNMVDTSRVHVICVNSTNEFDNNALMSQALDAAIQNYNSQNLQFTMQRGGGGCDANIAANLDNGGGGVAGFPANGDPYHEFFVGATLAADYGVPVATHVITHEMGHCVGFRHSDYYDRSISCGGGPTNEGAAGVGAEHIPGTPSDAVMNGSIMNSCFNGGSSGVWTNSDVAALDCLYDTGNCAPPPPPSYFNDSTFNDISGGRNSETHFGPFDASTYEAIRFRTTGGSGDADLYVRFGQAPSSNAYDCRPFASGNEETCEFNPASAGDYYVMLRGYRAYSGLTLLVDGAGNAPPPPPAEICDDGVDNDNDGDTDCADSDCAGDQACNGGSVCGDGVCEQGESCDGRNQTVACDLDCDSQTGGKPSSRWCEVEGVCEGPGCP